MLQRLDPHQLRLVLDPAQPCFVLVDPVLGEPLNGVDTTAVERPRQRMQAWGRAIVDVVLPDVIALPRTLHPYLVQLSGPDDPWLSETTEVAQLERETACRDGLQGQGRAAHRIGGWLQSTLDPVALAAALAERMRLRTVARTQARYLRLADRRTLDWLSVVVSPLRLAAALSHVVQRWAWLDGCGRLAVLHPGGVSAAEDGLMLSGAQWAAFEQASLVHPCLARCLGHDACALDSDAGAALARVSTAVQQARGEQLRRPRQLRSDDDVIAWAALSVVEPAFEQRADVTRWLDDPAVEPSSFDAFARTLAVPRNRPAASSISPSATAT